ncbi:MULTISPECIES: NAD(P)H-dependent oxidoreductase subunit E [Methylococcus]|uniref:NADH-quinone oxidoreductase subunit F n=1 Tax=Methylococcus capsulatus TaxID=414 RepID=A0ABZ2F765_METCP|nr:MULTISPECIES: NAD(P)H-dependent oxidoreductase subunit E [Methylococcus]MDF9392353.1 NADP oxidoreductase [Methylococcus capsulatus]
MDRYENERRIISGIVENHGRDAHRLLSMLREVQQKLRHVSPLAQRTIAESLGICITQVSAVVEFYSFLSTTPLGKFDIRISDSITDHMLGSRDVAARLCRRLGILPGETRHDGRVSLTFTSCTGLCEQGPAGLINGYAITRLTEERTDRIAGLINNDTPLDEWPGELFTVEQNIQLTDRLLGNPVQPGDALGRTLALGRETMFGEIETSQLRGRGGAGFNTAWKWRFCYDGPEAAVCPPGQPAAGIERYVVCNADEGEPGTFKDRVLLQSSADQVFEGMTVCAHLVGAKRGFLYLRGEYLYLYDRLEAVLAARRQRGLLGKAILGKEGFDFDIEIRLGAGAYICGEESALIESLEGNRGIPRNRPPYPVTHGYLGQPTVVNNVETFFAAAAIAVHGGEWFAAVGTEKSKGTKLLSICGDCARPGIYEYPFGVTVARILEDCGAADVLGVQIGGPSGTFLSDKEFDRKLAYEDLATGGSFIVFDRTRDVIEIARNFTHFFAHESCGFCTPCRVGTPLLKNLLDKIAAGHGATGDLAELSRLGRFVRSASHCGLGQTAANPILSTLERYPEIYQARLKTIDFEPGFDLDGALATARRLTGRDDANAHLSQS